MSTGTGSNPARGQLARPGRSPARGARRAAVADRVEPEHLGVVVLGLDQLGEERGQRRPARRRRRRPGSRPRCRVEHEQRGVQVVEPRVDQPRLTTGRPNSSSASCVTAGSVRNPCPARTRRPASRGRPRPRCTRPARATRVAAAPGTSPGRPGPPRRAPGAEPGAEHRAADRPWRRWRRRPCRAGRAPGFSTWIDTQWRRRIREGSKSSPPAAGRSPRMGGS